MTEEEKKAISLLKSYENKLVYEISDKDKKAVKILLNLIDKQQEEIERLKNAEEYAKLGKETLLDTIHKQEKEIERLKNDKKKALNYINQEMYVDTNPTICEMEDEENTIIELPISLNLYNEDLRKLLDLLEEN